MREITVEKEFVKQSRLSQIDFNDLKFGSEFSDHMLVAEYQNGQWQSVKIQPFGVMPFSPAASVFHYGQAIFEGLKAHAGANGNILLFRPMENLNRLNRSAARMCMPSVPEEIFLEGIKALIEVDRKWVPQGEGQSLYIRPFLIADEPFLGVKPSGSYKFIVITCPSASYYSGAVKVKVESHYSRACEGGIGATKAAANYGASLFPAQQAQAKGYDQLVWTDAKEHKFIEESGTMNIMLRINGTLITPSIAKDTILPGITRNSVIQLAKEWGNTVEERPIAVEEVIAAIKNNALQEAFGIGTAATIAPISLIGIEGEDHALSDFSQWEFAPKVKDHLEQLKRGRVEDRYDWLVRI